MRRPSLPAAATNVKVPDANDPRIDQFIADEERLNRGVGTAFIRQFVGSLMEDPSTVEVRVDPRPDNGRAIRCYEKVGFVRVGDMITADGPATLMVLHRSDR